MSNVTSYCATKPAIFLLISNDFDTRWSRGLSVWALSYQQTMLLITH